MRQTTDWLRQVRQDGGWIRRRISGGESEAIVTDVQWLGVALMVGLFPSVLWMRATLILGDVRAACDSHRRRADDYKAESTGYIKRCNELRSDVECLRDEVRYWRKTANELGYPSVEDEKVD